MWDISAIWLKRSKREIKFTIAIKKNQHSTGRKLFDDRVGLKFKE
jgi:hypothetical protein